MRLPSETYQIRQTIETHLPHLSQPQLAGLALWVCGAILAGSACQNAVASALSPWRKWNNLRQYLREWLYDGSDRARPCKTQLDVTLCFAPLLRWVLTWWRSGRLALAIDPTLKGDQTTAIVISVLYRGCAIPVAWSIHRATQPGSWMDPIVGNCSDLRGSEGLKGENRGRIPVADAQDDGYQTAFGQFAPPSLNSYHSGTAPATGPSSPQGYDRHRALRPGHIQPQAVAADTRSGLASLYALPEEHHLLRRRRQTIACPRLRLRSRHCLGRPRHRLRPHLPPSAVAPCSWFGTPSRKNPGSSSPTCLPRKWGPVGTPCGSGSNWASRPSKV